MKNRKFEPKPGQVDYTNIRWTPVINCVLRYRGKLLVVRRSDALRFYPSCWNGISGFLDDRKSLREKVAAEIREELGMPKSAIRKIQIGEIFEMDDLKYMKTWIVHPVLVDVATDEVNLDWEAQNYRWLTPREVQRLKLLPGFRKVLQKLSPWIR